MQVSSNSAKKHGIFSSATVKSESVLLWDYALPACVMARRTLEIQVRKRENRNISLPLQAELCTLPGHCGGFANTAPALPAGNASLALCDHDSAASGSLTDAEISSLSGRSQPTS